MPVSRDLTAADDYIKPNSIDEFMVSNLKKTGLPGVSVSIIKGNKVIYTAGYGNDSEGNPITADTKMYIGSVSKSFTSLAVMQLVEQGKIQLQKPVKSYLPNFVTEDERSDKITVTQLLNQSSGLSDKSFPEMSLSQPNSLMEEMKRLSGAHLTADPGTQWNYHNPNYHILAQLVEQVSGQPFNQYIKNHILTPLNMSSTISMTFAGNESEVERGYTYAYGMPIARKALPHFVIGSGGMISTANDMTKWIAMQNGDLKSVDGTPLVSPESLRVMHTPSGPDNEYAYGWEQDVLPDGSKRIEHGGTLFTYSSDAALFPEKGYAFVVMFNSATVTGAEQQSFIDGLTSIVQNKTPELGAPIGLIVDSTLGLLTLLLMMFFTKGVRSVNKWAMKFCSRGWFIILARNVPYIFSVIIGIFFLDALGFLVGGRDITWTTVIYGWPALLIFIETLAIGSAIILISRIFRLVGIKKRNEILINR
ncbi:hypothetical protein AF332_14910 [Sporosarcina globispora]|uniref:Beta-lactamase-related domain-containing protein n=1 Tax=Sporosarcina globispora TaxID=1459 RepID=A0A0M0GKK1_SPOGL|nr:hypothetical protein AF332_14910 [Sporosarcina globispora]